MTTKLDLYASAQTIGNKDRRTACAMVLVATAPDGRVQVRKMAFPLGTSTINLAGLQALRLALMGLRPWVATRPHRLNVFTDSHYALEMLARADEKPAEKGGEKAYKADPKSNVEAVSSLREWCDKFPGLALNYQKFDGGIGNECLALARDVATSQTPSDSGTKEFPDGRQAGI